MSKLKNFAINTVLLLLIVAPFFLAFLIVYKLGIDANTQVLKYVLVYLGFVAALETIPLAITVYMYGDYDHMDFNIGSSDSGIEIPIIAIAFLLLIGKSLSKFIVGKKYYKTAKGNLIKSLVSGIIISTLTYIVFVVFMFIGIAIYSIYKDSK